MINFCQSIQLEGSKHAQPIDWHATPPELRVPGSPKPIPETKFVGVPIGVIGFKGCSHHQFLFAEPTILEARGK